MDLRGLAEGCRIAPATLGHRGSQLVVDMSDLIESAIDERSKLPFCPVKGVFEPGAVFLGFGTPNVFLMVPNEDQSSWDKFTAFMFYRQESYVARSMDRMQLGFYYELRDLPEEALQALRREMQAQAGQRTASCANANARVLAAAGFTSGDKPLKEFYRPSHLAAHIWANGLEYKGQPVSTRPVQAGREVGDHFVAVWWKEFTSACRSIKKKFIHRDTSSAQAPRFEELRRVGMTVERWEDSTEYVRIGISRPSWLGVWLGFVLGQRPVFTLMLEEPLPIPELEEPLLPFPGKLNRMTKFKKHVLFRPVVVAFIRRHLMRSMDFHDVPVRAVVEMLRRSPSPERENAFVYNLAVTDKAIQITRLENRNGRDRKFINWIMAKHLVLTGYTALVGFAGETWGCKMGRDYLLCLNGNSGTYMPGEERVEAVGNVLSQLLDVEVRTVARGEA